MKMFLTRIGFGSKVIVTGDSSQKDLPSGQKSGLEVALQVLKKVEGISVCELTSKDVVRHPLVQRLYRLMMTMRRNIRSQNNSRGEITKREDMDMTVDFENEQEQSFSI